MGYRIKYEKMNDIIQQLSREYRIFAPKKVGKYIRYGEVTSFDEVVYKEKSHFSPKEVVFPIIQTLLYFSSNSCEEKKLDDERPIIIFARACDINGIRRLDTIFMENGGFVDNFYARLREKVKFFLLECKDSFDTCFCVSMGSNQSQDYSVGFGFEEDGVHVLVKEDAFASVFSGEEVDFTPAYVKENRKQVQIPELVHKELVQEVHQLPLWREFDDNCIGCGGCNTVCITCSCFDTTDVIYNETSLDGERRRVWSSCMLKDYSTMAGGHNVRSKAGDRMRFKVMHKIYDYKNRFGKEHMCVGCGRCEMRCPKQISLSETVNKLSSEVNKLEERWVADHE
ncbi:MAG: anaerobic sulfite reductase subunit AsrA [Agathobacter sp.]|nr:anaerobic sulfite reductase subunit AsrA [Agathobacter sp.]